MKKVIVALAEGFELCEALIVVDLLKRAGIAAETAGVGGSLYVRSSCGVEVKADGLVEAADFGSADMLVLPGGIPGAHNLAANRVIREQSASFAQHKALAAICASPAVVLASLGLLNGKRATVHPGFERDLEAGGAVVSYEGVTVDGNIITARAVGAGFRFGLAIVELLEGQEKARQLEEKIYLQA